MAKVTVEEIHELVANREYEKMAEQIDHYGSTFWLVYKAHLDNFYGEAGFSTSYKYKYFATAVINYHRIK